MSDTIGSLLGAADRDMPKVKKKGNKFTVEGDDQEYDTYEDAIKAAARLDAGPTMTAGNPDMTSALGDLDTQPQPSAKAPGASTTGSEQATPSEEPEKPEWIKRSEEATGTTYEYDPVAKQWRPSKKNKPFTQGPNAPLEGRL